MGMARAFAVAGWVLAGTALVAAAQEPAPGAGAHRRGEGGQRHDERLAEYLGLDAQQKAAVQKLRQQQREEMTPLWQEGRDLRRKLREATEADKPDALAVGRGHPGRQGAPRPHEGAADGVRAETRRAADAGAGRKQKYEALRAARELGRDARRAPRRAHPSRPGGRVAPAASPGPANGPGARAARGARRWLPRERPARCRACPPRPRRRVREDGRLRHRRAGAEREGEPRDDGVAGAGHVEHLPRRRRDVEWPLRRARTGSCRALPASGARRDRPRRESNSRPAAARSAAVRMRLPVACSASSWFGVITETRAVQPEVRDLGVHEHRDSGGGGRATPPHASGAA